MEAKHPVSRASNLTKTLERIGLWFGSLLVFVTLFSLLFANGAPPFRAGSVVIIFRVTMIFVFPVWCLYLPFVIAIKSTEKRQIWILILAGILIGPASLAVLGLFLQLEGADPIKVWQGDPLTGIGGIVAMIFAMLVGLLTTSFYVIASKALHRG